jgi:hypothetical protein
MYASSWPYRSVSCPLGDKRSAGGGLGKEPGTTTQQWWSSTGEEALEDLQRKP